jgi:putative colanic acid biosynthesis acetyltransferase WcaB
MSFRAWKDDVFQDWQANPRAAKSQLILVAFRQARRWQKGRQRVWHAPAVAIYTVLVNWILGVELPPETEVGPALRLLHPQAIVINRETRIGARCTVRASTTLGNISRPDGTETDSPCVGDDVEFGVGAIVIGPVRIGDSARIGAGAVVVKDVPAGTVAVGNPARLVDAWPKETNSPAR